MPNISATIIAQRLTNPQRLEKKIPDQKQETASEATRGRTVPALSSQVDLPHLPPPTSPVLLVERFHLRHKVIALIGYKLTVREIARMMNGRIIVPKVSYQDRRRQKSPFQYGLYVQASTASQ